jgi:Predicted AAA-ATPase/PD-(D/E)XK nuclease superfamily
MTITEVAMSKKSPIGVDDFVELVSKENNFLFVDKTLLIKELIDDGDKVSLIIRPRRWGKTLNMSMLRYFFAPTVKGVSTTGLFDDLAIAKEAEGFYLKHQGRHPVVFISLKGVKQDSFESFYRKMIELIKEAYSEHEEVLLSGSRIIERKKGIYKNILNGDCNQEQLENALKFLSECLERHYGQKVIILIDEYDTPLNAAYHYNYFDRAVNFFKNLLGAALKGNDSLHKGVLTGILRLSKNSMLSDINNLSVYSLMEDVYSSFFGFSEKEVKGLFDASGISLELASIQKWYNGYRSGHLMDIYNPWSVLNCLKNKGRLDDYWIKTGDEKLLNTIFVESGTSIKEKLNILIAGGSIESVVDDYVSFEQMKGGQEQVLWSLLWALGYLKAVGEPKCFGSLKQYHLQIPNYEVGTSYRNVFIEFINGLAHFERYYKGISHLVVGEVEVFATWFQDFMRCNVSYFDCSTESNYHMLFLGMSAYLKETHDIFSNLEQGDGRPDLMFIPLDVNNPLAIIIEFKRAEKGKMSDIYEQLATEGLNQITQKHYDVHLKSKPTIKRILKLCLVFYSKEFSYKYLIENTNE